MTEQIITNLADVRPGDTVTAEYAGHRFTGEAWEGISGCLGVGNGVLRYPRGWTALPSTHFIEARRPIAWPTAPGSVVVAQIRLNRKTRDHRLFALDGIGERWVCLEGDASGDLYAPEGLILISVEYDAGAKA